MTTGEISPQVGRDKTVLLPELGSNAVKAFQVRNEELGLPVTFEEMSLVDSLELLQKGEVGAVLAGATHTTGEVISEGIQKFNPRRNTLGEEDPMGDRQRVSSFFVFERQGNDPFIISDCAVNESPEQLELIQIAEQTVTNAQRLGIEPRVAFLSYSTMGSGHGDSSAKMRAVANLFRETHKDIPVIGEVQFDAATDERIYKLKTGQKWPGGKAPNVLIVPNLDTGNSIYKVLQSHMGGGWTAIGPLLQGFEGDRQLHDLSRGVTPEALEVICKYVAKLSGIALPSDTEIQQYGDSAD